VGAPSGPAQAPPYGARLRLRSDFPLTSLPNEAARTVARAMQQYGIVLADGGNVALTARSDRFTTTKWTGLLGSHDLQVLKISDFEMVAAGARYAAKYDCQREPPPVSVVSTVPVPLPALFSFVLSLSLAGIARIIRKLSGHGS
jgi:hypothetical protein